MARFGSAGPTSASSQAAISWLTATPRSRWRAKSPPRSPPPQGNSHDQRQLSHWNVQRAAPSRLACHPALPQPQGVRLQACMGTSQAGRGRAAKACRRVPLAVSPLVPAQLPTGTTSLPQLGGRLFATYRAIWWALLSSAAIAATYSLFDPGSHPLILALRLAKSVVLIAVAVILFRRRQRDPVAAMLGISFLLWTVSSSVNFIGSADASWLVLLDRLRFLPFALALLLFPDGQWRPRLTGPIAAAIFIVFIVGAAEALGGLETVLSLPLAIGCVLLAMGALLTRYRSQPLMAQQQLKWVTLGLVVGIGFILSARVGAALATAGSLSMAGNVLLEALFQLGIVVIALGFLTSLL